MIRFRYEAADALGKLETGHVEADSQGAALAGLRSRGLTALHIHPTVRPAAVGRRVCSVHGSRTATWRRSPGIDEALSATVEQAERKHIIQTLGEVRTDVRSGMRLAEALAARPRDFPDIYRALIAAGEESGDLAQVMERLADYIEERNMLRGKILTAFIYPCVVGLVSIAIVIFLLSYVVPQVVSAFSQARQDLPGLTLAMLAASDFIRTWGLMCLVGIVAMAWGWRIYLRNPLARLAWHSRVLCRCCGRWKRRARRFSQMTRLSQSVSAATAKVREGGQPGGCVACRKSLSAAVDSPDRQWREDRRFATHARARCTNPVQRHRTACDGHDRTARTVDDCDHGRGGAGHRDGGSAADYRDQSIGQLNRWQRSKRPSIRRAFRSTGQQRGSDFTCTGLGLDIGRHFVGCQRRVAVGRRPANAGAPGAGNRRAVDQRTAVTVNAAAVIPCNLAATADTAYIKRITFRKDLRTFAHAVGITEWVHFVTGTAHVVVIVKMHLAKADAGCACRDIFE